MIILSMLGKPIGTIKVFQSNLHLEHEKLRISFYIETFNDDSKKFILRELSNEITCLIDRKNVFTNLILTILNEKQIEERIVCFEECIILNTQFYPNNVIYLDFISERVKVKDLRYQWSDRFMRDAIPKDGTLSYGYSTFSLTQFV